MRGVERTTWKKKNGDESTLGEEALGSGQGQSYSDNRRRIRVEEYQAISRIVQQQTILEQYAKKDQATRKRRNREQYKG